MKVDICQLGMDQRKVNMLARETAKYFNAKKPIAVHHHMLAGLLEPSKAVLETVEKAIEMKMSKSNPDSAIFMLDTKDEINRKIKKAWCPLGVSSENPILEYCKYIIFEKFDKIIIDRSEKFGGNLSYDNYTDLETDYINQELHPSDLKKAVAKYIDDLIKPVRDHFNNNTKAKKLAVFVKNAMKQNSK